MKKLLLFLAIALMLLPAAYAQATPSYQESLGLYQDVPAANAPVEVDIKAPFAQGMEDLMLLEDSSLITGSSGFVEFAVTIPADGLYEIELEYLPGEGSGSDIQRALYINGKLPFVEAGSLAFSRLWQDANRDYQLVVGNQPFPPQVESPQWRSLRLRDALGYTAGPFQFMLRSGQNLIRLESIQEGMVLRALRLVPAEPLVPYQDYLQAALDKGASYAGIAPVKLQAEDAILKSNPSLYPVNDRTSPMSEPYHPSYIMLNTLGGTAWNAPGEWLAWDFEVPEEGLYRIAPRFKQSTLRGMYATRSLRVNGEIPFEEAAELRFHHGNGFQFEALGAQNGEEGYWFHLQKGSNRIELEVTLGALGGILGEMDLVTGDLNQIYRSIIAITGTAPDINRNYQLFSRIPGLQDQLRLMKGRLQEIHDKLSNLIGVGNERVAGMTRLLSLMDTLVVGEEQVVKNLSAFKESITSIGKSVLDLKDQPLLIDWLMLLGKDTPQVQVNGTFWQNIQHTVGAFIGSFTNDYNVSAMDQQVVAQKEINVWISTGRDQFEVIRRLINESFTTENNIKVNLKLIGTDVLLPATFTGTGPEVALQIGNTAPVNFAFRGAAQDLKEFEDYEEVAARFLPAAMASYAYEGGMYALPDQMSFPVMFYRKDILNALDLEVPKTWTDLRDMIPELQKGNMEIYLDTNPPQTLGAAVSMGNARPINTVFLSRLFQTGGAVYTPNGDRSLLDTTESNLAFRWWTQFYTQHGFPRDIDFITRFRLGEVPLGIVDLSAYNTLTVSAPEIRNLWSIARVPGTEQEDGSISHAAPTVTGASMIIKNIADRNDTREEAWLFLKWWTSQETQVKYAREMEAVLGPAGRYLVSNLKAFEQVSWPAGIKQILMNILGDLRGIPEVPGGYITGRYLNNAFLSVITSYENPSDVLFENTVLINEEIAAKREEFGLLSQTQEGGQAP